jgi:hypothetical protein
VASHESVDRRRSVRNDVRVQITGPYGFQHEVSAPLRPRRSRATRKNRAFPPLARAWRRDRGGAGRNRFRVPRVRAAPSSTLGRTTARGGSRLTQVPAAGRCFSAIAWLRRPCRGRRARAHNPSRSSLGVRGRAYRRDRGAAHGRPDPVFRAPARRLRRSRAGPRGAALRGHPSPRIARSIGSRALQNRNGGVNAPL